MKLKLTFNTLILCLFIVVQAFAWEGRVVRVLDGDTVEVLNSQKQTTKVRLYGIDTPEKAQDFGQKAKQFTLDMVAGKQIDVQVIDTDRYDRIVGVIRIGGKILNEELLRAGMAWYAAQYCKKKLCAAWQQIEQQARSSKIGLWSNPHSQPPWGFRKDSKESRLNKKTDAIKQNRSVHGSFHGNVTSKTFHKDGCKHYKCKSCTAKFSSRQEALDAGYEPCGLCKP